MQNHWQAIVRLEKTEIKRLEIAHISRRDPTWAADGHVEDLVVAVAAAAVVDQADADAEDGDVDLLLDALVLAGRVGQAEAQVGVFREELRRSKK